MTSMLLFLNKKSSSRSSLIQIATARICHALEVVIPYHNFIYQHITVSYTLILDMISLCVIQPSRWRDLGFQNCCLLRFSWTPSTYGWLMLVKFLSATLLRERQTFLTNPKWRLPPYSAVSGTHAAGIVVDNWWPHVLDSVAQSPRAL